MSRPAPGVTEAEFLVAAEKAAGILSKRFTLPGHSVEDVRQLCLLHAWEIMPRFKADGNLSGFIFVHCKRRLANRLRDLVCRADPPCATCHQGEPCGPCGELCRPYSDWKRRQDRKSTLASTPATEFEEAQLGSTPSTAEDDAAVHYVLELLDANLDIDARRDWLQMRAGVNIPVERREELILRILTVLSASGLDLDVDVEDLIAQTRGRVA